MNTSGLHLFVFFTLCPGRIAGPTMTLYGSKCTVSAKEGQKVNFGAGNMRFWPYLQNFQMTILLEVVI